MIEGKITHLRTVKEKDLEELYAHFDSLRVRGEYLPASLLSEKQFKKEFEETGLWTGDRGTILLTAPNDNRIIGAIWFERAELFDCLSLRFLIFRENERGIGIMSDALDLFCSYLFSTKKVQRLQIAVPDYLKPAIRVAQKCGFQFEGIARESLFHKGRYLDLCLYSLLRNECKNLEKIYLHYANLSSNG